jgi:outer membrane receptor protein involved in Fe transport
MKILHAAIVGALMTATQGMVAPAVAMAQETTVQAYRIPAGNLDDALRQYAAQNKLQLIYSADLVKGKRSTGLTGTYTQGEALHRLLSGTGVQTQQINARTISLKPGVQKAAPPAPNKNDAPGNKEAQAEPEPEVLDAMTVTGTRIRGGTTPSPVITIGSEQIREEGFADLGEVIRSIPQNFAGGQNPGVATGAHLGGESNQNITGGSGLNLRGLGADATLTLLNGRRMAYDGFAQAVDVSSIPTEAVERLEIVPDGASAIYGSDAIGGVANVILKRDYEGVAVGARYGSTADGGLTTHEYLATAGHAWSSGGLIATYRKVSVDPIFSDQRDYTESLPDPTTIYSGTRSYSGLISAHQDLGDRVELRLDMLRSKRDQPTYAAYPGFYYYFTPGASIFLVSPSLEISLAHDWSLTAGATYGKNDNIFETYSVDATGGSLAQYGCRCNSSRSYEVSGEGPLFTSSAGEVRLAVGGGYRKNEFSSKNYVTAQTTTNGDEGVRFAYAELNAPLVGGESGIAGAHRLAATVAVRSEDYDNFGRVTTPKLGLIYDPSADFTLKASWGKSFKAPTLNQQFSERQVYLMPVSMVGGTGYAPDATALISFGSNPDLQPERARSLSASLAFHPEALPDLEAELTWFDIEFSDRVVSPLASYSIALSNPDYAKFVDYSPSPAQQKAFLDAYGTFINYVGGDYDPGKVVATVRDNYINVARQRIDGIDLSGSYRFDLGAGRLVLRGSASWLHSRQRTIVEEDERDLAGMIFNPARYRARVGAIWTSGGFSAAGFVNYASGVTSELTTVTRKTSSFTTADTTLRYDTGDDASSLSGLAFELSAQNVFNRKPPLYTPPSATYVPYDSTNYSAIGRFVNLSVSKRF